MEPGLRENPVGKSVHVYSYFTFIERVILDSCITKCIYLFIIFYLKLTSHHRMPAETKGEWTKRTLFKHTSLLKNSNDIFICCGFLLFCSMFMICSCAREGREETILLHKKKKKKKTPWWSSYRYAIHLGFIVQPKGSNMRAHTAPVCVNF